MIQNLAFIMHMLNEMFHIHKYSLSYSFSHHELLDALR